MRLRDEYKQPVRRRDAWLAIGFVALLVSAMGVTLAVTGKVPDTPWPVWAALIVWVICMNAYRFARYGRRAFASVQLITAVGVLMFACSQLPVFGSRTSRWVGNIALLLLLVSTPAQVIEIGRPRPAAPTDSTNPAT